MPLFEEADDRYWKTRSLYEQWHRNDFLTHLIHESTGGSQLGASGDALLGQALWQRNATNVQIQKAADQLHIGTDRIQGVQVSNTPPTNGQVLTFVTSQNQYVPMSPSSGTGSTLLAGSGGDRAAFSLVEPGDSLFICNSGNTIVKNGPRNTVEILIPYNGTAKNLTMKVAGNPSAPFTFTLTLYKNGVATALTQTVSGLAGAFIVVFQNLINTVPIALNDLIYLQLDSTVNTTMVVFGFSMELVHA